jgi:hypothetical protein
MDTSLDINMKLQPHKTNLSVVNYVEMSHQLIHNDDRYVPTILIDINPRIEMFARGDTSITPNLVPIFLE